MTAWLRRLLVALVWPLLRRARACVVAEAELVKLREASR